MRDTIVLATRKSRLALAQTQLVAEALTAANLAREVTVLEVTTSGDQNENWSLETEGGKGLFTKEVEAAVLEGRADAAIHSAKDLPTDLPDGLTLAAFLPREQAHDVLVRRESVDKLCFIATGSPRRRMQLKQKFACAAWKEIRGNVETRLKKIASGKADATVLAAAGLNRLGFREWPGLVFEPLGIREVVPAVGQGAIAVQTRTDAAEPFTALDHAPTRRAVEVERAFLSAMGGGCHSATAAHLIGRQLLVYHEEHGFAEFEFGNGEVTDISARLNEILAQGHFG